MAKIKAKQERKSGLLKAAEEAPDLNLVNQHTRTPLTAEQIYTMKLTLCDNETDRQYDQFTPNALTQLAAFFIGKSVIFDHEWKAKNQTARIYATQVEQVPGKSNSDGRPYQRLIAMAYMLNTEGNAETIAALEGGILKEGSIGFSNSISICSICGQEYYSAACAHLKACEYDGKTCITLLDGITDAYEFSLVAVPAQQFAGITKGLKDGRTLSADTVKKLSAARKLHDKAQECIKEARDIEDDLVGKWPSDDGPMGEPQEDPPATTPEDPDELKTFKAEIKLLTGGKKE